MNYQQIGDTLNVIRKYHKQFRDALAEIESVSSDELTGWIAAGMQQHEQHWQMALAEYEDEGADAVLNTWIQFVPDEPIQEELRSIVVTGDLTVDEISDLAIRFHDALVDLYETLANGASTPRVQEFFSRLLELERTVTAQQAWAARSR